MRASRDLVVDVLRSRGEHDRALEARCALPAYVDTEGDAGLLTQFDVEPSDLEPTTP